MTSLGSSSSSKPAAQQVAFVSGHMNLTEQEFKAHYVEPLNKAAAAKHEFVLGNAPGADTMALDHLIKECKVQASNVTAYAFSFSQPKLQRQLGEFKRLGIHVRTGPKNAPGQRFKNAEERDAALTEGSTYDIAWVRGKEENARLLKGKYDPMRQSGTEKNLQRRHMLPGTNLMMKPVVSSALTSPPLVAGPGPSAVATEPSPPLTLV